MANEFGKINNYFNETLANGEKSILDAWLIKLYNCFGCTALLTASQASETAKPLWQINWINNTNGNNYIEDIFTQQIPSYK
ncbi:MAG: hypothetical protein IPJ54_02595 [Saprospiraceae bacterium]|nr:hypothetical protein [Saprospiraceae bacterium]